MFYVVFMGYRKATPGCNGLKVFVTFSNFKNRDFIIF